MEALVKPSKRKGAREVLDKQVGGPTLGRLGLHRPSRIISQPKEVEIPTQLPKASDGVAADACMNQGQMLVIQPPASPKPRVPEPTRYNISYKNGRAEFIQDNTVSDPNSLQGVSPSTPGRSKVPCELKPIEVRAVGRPSPGANSKHTSPSRRSNVVDKSSKPASPSAGSPIMRLQKELEPVKRHSKLDKPSVSNSKPTSVNGVDGVHQPNSYPVDFNVLSPLEFSGQRIGHGVANVPGKVLGKENSSEPLRHNPNSQPEDLSRRISNDPTGETGVLSPRRVCKPTPRLKVRDDNSSGCVGLGKKSSPSKNLDAAGANQIYSGRGEGGKGTGDSPSTERRALVSSPQQKHAKKMPLANIAPRHGGKEERSRPSQGVGKGRGGILPPLALADRRRESVGSSASQSPQLSVIEVSNLLQSGADGKEAVKERAHPAVDGVGPRAPPLSTTSRLERLQQQLQSQDAKMRQLQKKERSWEEQVKQLKVELRNAREKERALYKIVGIDPKLPRRAETAPDPPSIPKEKPHNGLALVRKPHDLRKATPSEGGRLRAFDNKPDFLKAHIFSRDTFRAITAPDLPEVGWHKSSSALRTTVRPLLNALVPSYPLEENGTEEIERSEVQSLKLASLNTRQTALCLPHETDTDVKPVGIHFGHLLQFVDAQIITRQQAQGLWGFLCARKGVSYKGSNTEKGDSREVDAPVDSATGKTTKSAVHSSYNYVRNSAQSRSPVRDYGVDHFESAQQVPVLTKALRRKIEDSHLKKVHSKASTHPSEKEEATFDGAPPFGSCELTTTPDFSSDSTNNTMDQELCSNSEVEKVTEIIHLSEFQSSVEQNAGYREEPSSFSPPSPLPPPW